MVGLRSIVGRYCFAAACGLGVATGAAAQPASLTFERVVSGLNSPLGLAVAPGRENDLFVLEKGGVIKRLDLTTQTVSATPFLTITGVDTQSEGGLLGLAFHPDFATNGKLYVNVTFDNGGLNVNGATSPFSTHIREYTVANPLTDLTVNANTADDILTFAQPQANHNGGWIGFKPRDTAANLYIMSGDGGSSNDTGNGHTAGIGNAQDLTNNLLGKVLRIDVDGDDFAADNNRDYAIPTSNPFVGVTGDDEIFAYGLRNPFRASFDRQTGDLYLGDVGQNAREEIDVIQANSPGGENFGWRLREGDIQTPSVGGPVPADYAPPIYDYTRGTSDFQGQSVTGGVLYRGAIPELKGQYIFGDFVSQQIWAFDPDNPDGTITRIDQLYAPSVGTIGSIASFGEDAAGNLYVVDLGGEIYRLGSPAILGDYNGNGVVDAADYTVWQDNFNSTTNLAADGNFNGIIDAADYTIWQDHFGNTAPSSLTLIPEPTSLMLIGVAGLFASVRRRR